ncbi:MAG: hypothetical protein R2734_08425 [Nocardioides sp.]
MTAQEEVALAEYDRLLVDPEFVAGTRRPARAVRTIKIRAGVWVLEYHPDADDERHVVVTVAGGVIRRASGDLPDGVVGLDLARAATMFEQTGSFAPLAAALSSAQAEVAVMTQDRTTSDLDVAGYAIRLDRGYHTPTHQWLLAVGDRVRIGLDALTADTYGVLAQLLLPAPGDRLQAGSAYGSLGRPGSWGPWWPRATAWWWRSTARSSTTRSW